MKTKNYSLLIGASLALVSLTSANAALVAYEGFDYAQNTGLNNQTGGIGWTTDWIGGNWRTNNSAFTSPQPGGFENSTGLTYTGLTTVGNAARNGQQGNQGFRSFATQAATGTYWISFLMQKDTTTSGSYGISLYEGGTERNFMGTANSGNFSVGGQGANVSSISVSLTPSLFVARYNMDTQLAHFWIDSDLSSTTPTDASAFNGSGGTTFTAFAFNRIRLGGFHQQGYLDEIRIGTTAMDVGFIPEPSSFALVGLSVLGFVANRRRRA